MNINFIEMHLKFDIKLVLISNLKCNLYIVNFILDKNKEYLFSKSNFTISYQ